MAHSKQQNKHGNIPEEDWTSDTLDNNFDTTILIMYKEQKEQIQRTKGDQKNDILTKWEYQQTCRNYIKGTKQILEMKITITKI